MRKLLHVLLATLAVSVFAQTPRENLQRVPKTNTVIGSALSAPFQVQTIAALKAVTVANVADGQKVEVVCYATNGDGGGGVFVYDEDSVAADNGGTVIAPNSGSGRWLRVIESPVVNAKWFGLEASPLGDDSQAAENTAVANSICEWVNGQVGLTVVIPELGDGYVYYFGDATDDAASGGVWNVPADTTLQIDGYCIRKSQAVGRFVSIGGSNVTITGRGTLDGNANVTAVRNENAFLIGTTSHFTSDYHTNVVVENLLLKNSPVMAVNIGRVSSQLWIRSLKISNYYGSVDGAEPDDVSGDNCDGIHVYNASNVWIYGNYVEAIDDCIAITYYQYSGASAEQFNINIFRNICYSRKAANVAAAGLGSSGTAGTLSRYLGAGVRVSAEDGMTGLTLAGVSVCDNFLYNGQSGVIIGPQDSQAASLSRVTVARNHIFNTQAADGSSPTDYDVAQISRAVSGGIFCGAATNVVLEDNEFYYLGCGAVIVRNSSEITARNNRVEDTDTSRSGLTVSNAGERAAFQLLTNPATASLTNVSVYGNAFNDIDGAAIYCAKETGAGAVTGLRFRSNRAEDCNTSGGTTARSAVWSLRNGTAPSDIEILENEGNRIVGFDITGLASANEQSSATSQSVAGIVSVPLWTADIAGSGMYFEEVNGAGTMTLAIETDFNGVVAPAHLTGTGANDEFRGALLDTGLVNGNAMKVEVWIWMVSGTITVGNSVFNVSVPTDANPHWRKYTIILASNEASTPRLRFVCSGAGAEFYLGPLEVSLVNH